MAQWPDGLGTMRLLGRLSALYAAAAGACLLPGWVRPAEAFGGGLVGVAAGSLLLALTGLLATLPMARARWRMAQPVPKPWVRWSRLQRPAVLSPVVLSPAERLARLARRPQGMIVPGVATLAAAAAWGLRAQAAAPLGDAVVFGVAAIVLTFPLLVAERIVAAVNPARLPEARALQALMFVPVVAIPLAGLLEIAAGAGFGWARPAMLGVSAFLCLVAAELAIRALANWFLPPPPADTARAAVGSMSALLLRPGRIAPDGLAAPLRTHLGLDFSRSWALRYVRGAALPVALLMVLVGWALSGVTLVNMDQRAVYERFGAPVAVWQPGAHAGLPWPLGRVRVVELGVIHAVGLGMDDPAAAAAHAEDDAPASADRLWDGPHPAEVAYILASVGSGGAQSFQTVSVDLRVLYTIGADDPAALRAAYAVASPATLVRAQAGRLLARFFAAQTLDQVMGENREAMADGLRAQLQQALDRDGAGIVLAGVVIEAIHPPAAAAAAYHNVQAAEIVANTAIATERGRAQAAALQARQMSAELVNAATAAAAEATGRAETLLRTFTADQRVASAGGRAPFLLERYLANVSVALARAPLVVVDHRLSGVDGPSIDLRSFGAPGGGGDGD